MNKVESVIALIVAGAAVVGFAAWWRAQSEARKTAVTPMNPDKPAGASWWGSGSPENTTAVAAPQGVGAGQWDKYNVLPRYF